MKISRHGIVERPNTFPHIAGAVVHGDTVYLQGALRRTRAGTSPRGRSRCSSASTRCWRWPAPTNQR